MREFSAEEIIKFAQRIEEESYNFYRRANETLDDSELKKLTKELSNAEVDHLNRLRKLIDESQLTREELSQRLSLNDEDYQKIINMKDFPSNPTAKDILEVALEREKNTASTYRMFLSFTDLSDNIIDVFNYLTAQEEGHVKIIPNRLKSL